MASTQPRSRHDRCSSVRSVHRRRQVWSRGLSLYRAAGAAGGAPATWDESVLAGTAGVHARSRFRHADDPTAFALYSVHDVPRLALAHPPVEADEHTLVVVREFRRVPLDVSGLALVIFTSRPGRAARVIATLAHWVERAVSHYQPTYLLLARSLEDPCLTVLLTGVSEVDALQAGRVSPFSLAPVLPEVSPMLVDVPERYVYCPELVADDDGVPTIRPISPTAV